MSASKTYTVCIDAGHGENTAGKRSFDNTFYEWEFNRDVAKRIKKYLDKYNNIKVIFTADEILDTSLSNRVKIAEENKADIFVSIHANAFGNEWNAAHGWEIYVFSNEGRQAQLANAIYKESIPYLGLSDRGIKVNSSFYVLKYTSMPAVLIEHGFYTNKEDLEKLKNDNFREKCALVDAKGIVKFFGMEWNSTNIANDNMVTKTDILINNQKYTVDRILYQDKNYIELRSFEQAGFKIDYDINKNLPSISTNTNTINLSINNKEYKVNRVLLNNENYVRLRDFEQAGFKVSYDNVKNIPIINCVHSNTVNTPSTPSDISHYLYDRYNVIEVTPTLLEVKRINGNLNKVEDKNVINTGYFVTQKVGGAYPLSIAINNGEYLKYSDTELADNVPHGKPAGTLIVYKNGKVEIKSVSGFDEKELKNIKIAIGGLTVLPYVKTKEEGFDRTTSEDGKDYTDVTRSANRVVIGYNPTKNKIVFVGGTRMSAIDGKNVLQKLGCNCGITCDAGGSAIMKINDKYIISSDNRTQFAYITF